MLSLSIWIEPLLRLLCGVDARGGGDAPTYHIIHQVNGQQQEASVRDAFKSSSETLDPFGFVLSHWIYI